LTAAVPFIGPGAPEPALSESRRVREANLGLLKLAIRPPATGLNRNPRPSPITPPAKPPSIPPPAPSGRQIAWKESRPHNAPCRSRAAKNGSRCFGFDGAAIARERRLPVLARKYGQNRPGPRQSAHGRRLQNPSRRGPLLVFSVFFPVRIAMQRLFRPTREPQSAPQSQSIPAAGIPRSSSPTAFQRPTSSSHCGISVNGPQIPQLARDSYEAPHAVRAEKEKRTHLRSNWRRNSGRVRQTPRS